ncbi:hypothetical protein COU88_04345 [Candidatus Roizmanbacteria bacterium CG10_big_fil_rev_8_21_14_0_10_39_6]|uniref:Uncharacterized protein n=1 Tax=Candidatus Roizmanbacteria bacterium CG10_big_fil_rev_8_21_14_0_10_39_6 TaxID=1974853 RepID=A0A2M8KRL9_9BACT|nr:MAG: hypothetical protein COU88_04345 [Candidatus Roizmanbacteria bacterium CG10_big_fil_rev_8_21_14_0_10_39_6]
MESEFHNPTWNDLEAMGKLVEPGIVVNRINLIRGYIETRRYWIEQGMGDLTTQEELDQSLSDLRLLFSIHAQVAIIYVDFLTHNHFNPDALAKWETFKDNYKLDI